MHGALRDVLYRGVVRGMPCLRATMLLGNHDTKHGQALEEIDFRLKAFNRDANGEPFLHAPQPPGRFLCLMDNGAWIEHCTYRLAEGDEVTEPSAQLGVMHGNDVRLYQIRVGVA
jgi:hypothetical protein